MILLSPAKINIGLHILKKRPDGFHDLDTCMLPLPFHDMVELQFNADSDNEINFSTSGLRISGDPAKNLCVKALNLYKSHTGLKQNISIHLHKQIPIGAGLGGGSSNASTILLGLNRLASKKLSTKELSKLAAKLGSDCPLFIHEKAMLAKGRGEILKKSDLDLSGYHVVLCNPGIVIPTVDAYCMVSPFDDRPPLEVDLARPISEWKDHIVNDFEAPIFALHPEIEALKRSMHQLGALYTSMSGSGSSVYGIFTTKPVLSDELRESLIWEGSF